MRGSSTDEREAERMLRNSQVQVAEQRHARTRASLRTTIDAWLATNELEASTRENYAWLIAKHIDPVLGDQPIGKVTAYILERFYAELRRCSSRCDGRPFVEHQSDGPHDCRTVRHKRPPGRPPAAGYPPHDCAEKGCVVIECLPHVCEPLGAAAVRKVHFVIRARGRRRCDGDGSAPIRPSSRGSPAGRHRTPIRRRPRRPRFLSQLPGPRTLLGELWSGVVMVTGLRRAELLALRWTDVDFDGATLYVRRNHVRVTGRNIEKDTKTHRARRLASDETTVQVLREPRHRYEERCRDLGVKPSPSAYLFSYSPTNDRPCDPSGVTHRYGRMCARLDIDSHLHALRHYSATQLLSAGVDLRTVAGRLGHGGGGATTLREYTTWVEGQ